jgi:hypothetical protein
MKRGRSSSKDRGRRSTGSAWSCAHLSIASSVEDQVGWKLTRVAHLSPGSSCDQSRTRGACRSEVFVAGKHEPDSLGELAGHLDPGHLRPSLAAEPAFGPLEMLAVERVPGGVRGRLDQRPPQVPRAVLREGSPGRNDGRTPMTAPGTAGRA